MYGNQYSRLTRRTAITSMLSILLVFSVFYVASKLFLQPFIDQAWQNIVTSITPKDLRSELIAQGQNNIYTASYNINETTRESDVTRIAAWQVSSSAERYSIDMGKAGSDAEIVLSPDRSRMYISTMHDIRAIATVSGKELWRVPLTDRMTYILGLGPTPMFTSPDGKWLYIYSRDDEVSDYNVTYWLQVFNTDTGRVAPTTIALPRCAGNPLFFTPATGNEIYLVCKWVLVLNSDKQKIVAEIEPGYNVGTGGAALSPDGTALYTVASDLRVATIDLVKRAVVNVTQPVQPRTHLDTDGYVAISNDGTRLFVIHEEADTEGHTTSVFRVLRVPDFAEVHRFSIPIHVRPFSLSIDGKSQSITFITSSNRTVSGEDNTVAVIDWNSGKIRAQRTYPATHILRVLLAP